MSNFIDFFVENDLSNITKEVRVSNRIPFKFKIKALTIDEHRSIVAGDDTKVDKNGAVENVSLVGLELMKKVCLKCTISPDFYNKELITGLKVNKGEEAIEKMLTSGEMDNLYKEINKLSGHEDINEDIKKAKN